jgi:hypothetical protein
MLKKVFQELNCTVAVVALSIRRRQYFHWTHVTRTLMAGGHQRNRHTWLCGARVLTETELLVLLWPLAGDCLEVEGESLWNKTQGSLTQNTSTETDIYINSYNHSLTAISFEVSAIKVPYWLTCMISQK